MQVYIFRRICFSLRNTGSRSNADLYALDSYFALKNAGSMMSPSRTFAEYQKQMKCKNVPFRILRCLDTFGPKIDRLHAGMHGCKMMQIVGCVYMVIVCLFDFRCSILHTYFVSVRLFYVRMVLYGQLYGCQMCLYDFFVSLWFCVIDCLIVRCVCMIFLCVCLYGYVWSTVWLCDDVSAVGITRKRSCACMYRLEVGVLRRSPEEDRMHVCLIVSFSFLLLEDVLAQCRADGTQFCVIWRSISVQKPCLLLLQGLFVYEIHATCVFS